MMWRARPPCASQHEQRRNNRKEKKNVIKIQGNRSMVTKLHRYIGVPLRGLFILHFVTFVTFLTFSHDHHCH
jgi:hypothetical protein